MKAKKELYVMREPQMILKEGGIRRRKWTFSLVCYDMNESLYAAYRKVVLSGCNISDNILSGGKVTYIYDRSTTDVYKNKDLKA